MPRFKSTPRSILGFQPDSGLSNPPDLAKQVVKKSEALVELTSVDIAPKSNMGSVSDSSIPARHSEPTPVSSVNDAECLGSLHVAALFAQAAALLTVHADRTFPVSSTYSPPIAPLGLSFCGFPNPIINGQELPKIPNPADGISITSVASNKGSSLLPGNRLFSRRSRPRIGHRADPTNSTRFPCWLPVNSTHARTKLRLLAESENLNLKNWPTSRKHRANPVRPTKSKEKLAMQPPQAVKSVPLTASPLPSPSAAEDPGPSALDERQSEPPSLVQSSAVLSSPTATFPEKPSSMVASSQDIRQLSLVRQTPVSKPSPPYSLLPVQKQAPPNDTQTKNAKQNHSSAESTPSKDNSLSTSPIFSTPARRTRSAVARESNEKKPIPKSPPDMESSSRSTKKPLGFVECKICHKSLRQSSMNEHLARHDNSGKYKCATCGVTFSRRSAQEKHERIHTGEKPFKCEHCPKAYRQMAHLRDHLRSHSGERPFVCRLCGFASGYKSLLRRHLRTHGVSKHPNAVPDLWYKTSGTKEEVLAVASEIGRKLESGQALVLGESGRKLNPSERSDIELARHHLCGECPAGFPTFQALRSHQITAHGLIRKHRCKLCGEEFASTGLRRQHSKQVHPLVCSICSKPMSTLQRSELKDHMQSEHSNHSTYQIASNTDPSANSHSQQVTRNGKRKPDKVKQSAVPDCQASPRLRDKNNECELMTWKRFCSTKTGSPSPVRTPPDEGKVVAHIDTDQTSNSSSITQKSGGNVTDNCCPSNEDNSEQADSYHDHDHYSSTVDEMKCVSFPHQLPTDLISTPQEHVC